MEPTSSKRQRGANWSSREVRALLEFKREVFEITLVSSCPDLPSYAPVPDGGLTKEVFSSVDVYDTNSLRCTLNIYSEKISVKQNLSSGQLYAIPNAVCRNDKYC
ncbi:uncharacterized protein LOC112571628 [Pomacea canaliculata]|uniref:uncharacterized protein LOC112571628 n=1 Tax=Pomacea canaliculata TaxID=400727 RepID=UPI000D732F57|nr:uncharacterized protein LOC112571628 [Pomacea canaliculata]